MSNAITSLSAAPLSATDLILNLALGTVLSLLLGWHYVRFGRGLSNRSAQARVFPFITLTTVLIISVVKSSLALSLGLVGALSIVRFRTPIKEPEELAYLFLSIGMGLALGANQRLAAVAGGLVILVIMALVNAWRGGRADENLYLNVSMPPEPGEDLSFQKITDVLAEHVDMADVRRMDVSADALQVTYFVNCRHDESLITAMDQLRTRFPQASITFVEQQNYLGG